MIKIKTPATSANLSVGFDTVGMAFNLYNTFLFNESKAHKLNGFKALHTNDSNLVLSSYMAFALKYLSKHLIKKVEITLLEQNIPSSRGLGSSASCILAGVLGSNHINKLNIPFKTCVDFACELEGHNDNIYACAYGSLTASLNDGDNYIHQTYDVSDKLYFNLLVSNQEGSTKALRNILPKKVDLGDAVYNLSRVIFLPDAFKTGDFKLMKSVLKDKLHEQYRFPYMALYKDLVELSKRDDLIVSISGSGPSVLLISNSSHIVMPAGLNHDYKKIEVKVSQGVGIEVIE